jgi:hypothetical protein
MELTVQDEFMQLRSLLAEKAYANLCQLNHVYFRSYMIFGTGQGG